MSAELAVQTELPAGADSARLPALIDRARFRLAEARTSAEALEARALADAALHLAKTTRAAMETHADCLKIVDRAEKLVGEKLIEAKESGELAGRGRKSAGEADLSDLGLTEHQSADWQRRARTPDPVVDNAINGAVEQGRAPTKADIKRAVLSHLPTPSEARKMAGDGPPGTAVVGRDGKFHVDPARVDESKARDFPAWARFRGALETLSELELSPQRLAEMTPEFEAADLITNATRAIPAIEAFLKEMEE